MLQGLNTSMPTKDLLDAYNGIADKPLAAWKGSKSALLDRINALGGNNVVPIGAPKTKSVQPKATEKPKARETAPIETGNAARTIREAALAWLCHVDYYEDRTQKSGPSNVVAENHKSARSVGITYLDVIANIQAEFPGCDTSVACLRWYSVKVRAVELGYEGYRLCQRRPRAKPSRS